MARPARHLKLEAATPSGAVRFLSGLHVRLQDGKTSSVVTLLKVGQYNHPVYGDFAVTRELLDAMVANYQAQTYGQRIFIDVAHKPENGAAGEITRLFVEGGRLRAQVDWTPYGIEAITERGFVYLSAEYHENWKDHDAGDTHGPVLMGAGLVTRPHIKRMEPVQLAEPEGADHVTLVNPELHRQLAEEAVEMLKKLLEQLRRALGEFNLAEAVISQLLYAFESAAKPLGEDKAALEAMLGHFTESGRKLAEQIGNAPATVNLQLSEGKSGLTAADVQRLLAEHETARQDQARQLAETLESRRKVFTDAIAAAEGLDEDLRRELSEQANDLVTAEMPEATVRKLAEREIANANKVVAARELAGMGWRPEGHVSGGASRESLSLQESINQNLARTDRGRRGHLHLAEEAKLDPFVERVLAEFDRINRDRLLAEHRVLANGAVGIADTNLPVGFQRTVIRESLSDLTVLNIVQTIVDPTAQATTQVPYETRDVSQVVGDGIVFEGAGIPKAGISQQMDLAYVVAMKLSLNLTNEVMHFSRASAINWDAWARNVESNSRYIRELIARRITNEWIRQADRHLAVSVSAESITAQLTGSVSLIKTAQFPIIRPKQLRDIKGTAIGSVMNPITLTVNGTVINEWDGTGSQSAGTYYRITNANLGYIQLVNQAGTPVTPDGSQAGADTISYDYTTNVVKFDLDIPTGVTKERHLNGLLQAVGARKAMLAQDRFEVPDFALMSYTLNDTATNAENFEANSARPDMGITGDGMMAPIKGLAPFATNGVSDLGEERILLGQRGMLSYVVAKPWMTGTPFEAVDGNGNPTGKKVAYGEEYDSIHVPDPIKGRATSVIAYSVTGR